MKQIVAAIYTNFRTTVVDDQGMEQVGGYTARPASERLVLRFDRLKSQQTFNIHQRVSVPDDLPGC
jgi:hypothetical protein